jgi:hypothetical protein
VGRLLASGEHDGPIMMKRAHAGGGLSMAVTKRFWPAGTLAALIALGLTGGSPVEAETDPAALELGYRRAFHHSIQPGVPWSEVERVGTWEVVDARRRGDGKLLLELAMDPPEPGIPVEPGPAMVFASLGVHGDLGGDVAWSLGFGRMVQAAAKPCSEGQDCELWTRLLLPTHRLGKVLEQAPNDRAWTMSIDLTLIRSFDQGDWLQIIPLRKRVAEGGDAGTLGDPGRFRGWMHNEGSFAAEQAERWTDGLSQSQRGYPALAALEQRRLNKGDSSAEAVAAPVAVDVEARACRGWTLATSSGDIAFDIDVAVSGRQSLAFDLPVGSEWYVMSPSLQVVDSHTEAEWFGPFAVEPSGIRIEGDWACDDDYWIVSEGEVSALPVTRTTP